MIRLADGDRHAFDEVYDQLGDRVLALCRRLVNDPVLAEDLAQEALVSVFAEASSFDPQRGSGTAWALGIAVWTCRSALRKRGRSLEDACHQVLATAPGDPEREALTAELLREVDAVLGGMTALDRDTLLVVWAEGPRPPVNAATFRKRWNRALQRFRAQWSVQNG